MYENLESLSNFINTICSISKIHICIHDISGITDIKQLKLNSRNESHSKAFCNIAKSTPKGFQLCISCKLITNKKAITSKKTFYGYCPYGMLEVVKPVIIEGKTQCIIYIGNIVNDKSKTLKKINHICKITKVPEKVLLSKINEAQIIDSIDYFIQLANIISSYIHMLYENYKFQKMDAEKHWAVSTLQNYVNNNFNQNISLQKISKLYFVNEKYAGRLFKEQIGMTFHQYLNDVRLDNAVKMLLNSNDSIINVAMNSGFQHVTYFNRVFLKKYGIPPTQFRNEKYKK